MSGSGDQTPHPAAKSSDQLAWAVWLGEGRGQECYAVVADSEAEAEEKAKERHDADDSYVHIDGPFQNSEPGVWEFEFVTEHRETIVVEGPNEDYAAETASAEREYRGEYVHTIRCDSRRLSTKSDGDSDE